MSKKKEIDWLETLRRSRQAQGVSQARVAEMAGISPSYYAKMERGEIMMSPGALEAVCKLSRIDLTEWSQRLRIVNLQMQRLFEQAFFSDPFATKLVLEALTVDRARNRPVFLRMTQ